MSCYGNGPYNRPHSPLIRNRFFDGSKKIKKGAERMKEKLQITMEVSYTTEDIQGILVTAFEGGINDWVEFSKHNSELVWDNKRVPYSEFAYTVLAAGGSLTLTVAEDDETVDLTMENLMAGLHKFLNEPHRYPVIDNGELNAGNIDAAYADVIIQYAVFGKLVYS